MRNINWRSVLKRAGMTFIETFGCIVIPGIAALLMGNMPSDINGWKMAAIAIGCPALGTAISVAWNVIDESLKANIGGE